MPRRRARNIDDDLDSEVDRTFDALEKDAMINQRGSRRISAVLRTQKDEDEERQKILMDMNARSLEKENPANNERMLEAMKIAVTKAKQLAARAFQEDLIDRLPSVVEKEPLYQAGSLLDASARIYSFRVDATHSEAYDVRSKLGDKSQGDNNNKVGKKEKANGSDDDDEEMNSDNEEDTGKKEGKDKKKKGEIENADSDSDLDLEDAAAKKNDVYDMDDLPVYIEEPASGTEDEQTALESSELIKKFKDKYDKCHENCVKRRAKVPMVVYDSSELNDSETGAEFCSHLYSKATHNFDEGSSSGLLMQNAITSKCGRRYMLHNNCRCGREPWNEKNDGAELHEIWSGIEDAERIGPSNNACAAVPITHDDELLSTTSRNTSVSQESTFMDTTASTSSNMQSIQKSVEAVLEEALQESGSKALFRWRRRLQKKFRMDSNQFVALLAHSLRNLDPFVKRSFIRQAAVPARKSYINRIADTKSGLTYAPIADELEPFEESLSWKVCKIRWSSMSNEARSNALKAIPGEHSTYNYFFARSAEQLSTEGDNVLGNLPVFRSIIEIEVPRDTGKSTGDDQKALAGVLDTFRIGGGESLFKKKGDDFGRKIAQIPIATPLKRLEQTAWERGSTISKEHPKSVVPTESLCGRSTIQSRMDDIDSEMDAGGYSTGFENDNDMDAEVASSRLGDFRSATDDAQSVTSKQTELLDKPGSVRVESSLRSERTDAASAYGDLHFVDEKRVAIMAYSIVNDETHWKKRKLDKGEAAAPAKGKTAFKLDKLERKKARKEEEKEPFEIGDFDSMPLAMIRDRQRQAKRLAVLVKPADELLKVPRARVAAELLYKPEQFCRLAHVFSGDWDSVRFHRAASAPSGDGKEERLSRILRQSIREDLDPEEAIKEHMSRFNEYFDDSCSEQRPASVPCSSHNDDDLFSVATQDNDDNESAMMPTTYVIPALDITHSFYSEPDSGAEEAEIFGVKYSVRQRRINAPAVKRAIGTILSNAKLDAAALNAELSMARQQGMSNLDGLNDLSIVSEENGQNLSQVDSQGNRIEMSAEEEQLQLREEEEMNDDPTCELRHTEVAVTDFKLAGRHTFSSVLAQLPSYLAGRTADDLSPINAFSVLLHLCNENNLELLQRKDDCGLIKPTEMGDFTIIPARKIRVTRKRAASECQ